MVLSKKLMYNTALLTASSLIMSGIGMIYQVWLVGRIGSAGIGLYQLVLSVSALTMTFAISGIRFASTRLVSEELGGETGAVGDAMSRCLSYALVFGCSAGIVQYCLAGPIGFLWIGDARTVLPLKISAISMPCGAVCASMSGYFTANGRVWKSALIHLAEQFVAFFLSAVFIAGVPAGNIERGCCAVTMGRVGADVISLIVKIFVYAYDRRKYYGSGSAGVRLTSRMLKIALPLAVSTYARSALSTIQHLLVPKGLKSAGFSADSALSGYGIIQGMVMPVIFFPACILSSVSELIIPELTEAQVRGEDDRAEKMSSRLFYSGVIYSFAVALSIFLLSEPLGRGIYKSDEAGYYIRCLAPLIPALYTDMCIDGCLKGLGQQMWSMGINLLDAALGLVMIIWLLPKYALKGYIAVIYFTEAVNFFLSYLRLARVLKGSRKI